MATDTFNFVQDFSEKIADGTHDLDTHTFKLMLTNSAPIATNTVKADLTDIAAGNGYTAGGEALTSVTWTESAGTATFAAADVAWNATGSVGPFQYAALYNDTAASDELIGWIDYGSAVTLANGESFTVSEASGWFTLS